MGIISDILDAILGESSTDPKETTYTVNDDGDARVRNTTVVIDHDNGTHDTIWSSTTVSGTTGQSSHSEGGHGPNFQK
jgi:hypothetical protein